MSVFSSSSAKSLPTPACSKTPRICSSEKPWWVTVDVAGCEAFIIYPLSFLFGVWFIPAQLPPPSGPWSNSREDKEQQKPYARGGWAIRIESKKGELTSGLACGRKSKITSTPPGFNLAASRRAAKFGSSKWWNPRPTTARSKPKKSADLNVSGFSSCGSHRLP
jgi:hypothetical protein